MGRISEALMRAAGTPVEPAPRSSLLESFSMERSRARAHTDRRANVYRGNGQSSGRRANDRFARAATSPVVGVTQPVALPGTTAAAPADLPSLMRVPDIDPEQLIDVRRVSNYAGFVARAVLRHKLLSFFAFTLTLCLTAAAIYVWPQSWGIGAKLLVQRNAVMSSLVNPARTIPREAEAPTRAAEEIILRRDNLLSIIQQTNLVEEWERTRAPVLKTKDRLFGMIRPAPTANDRVDAMVGLLERDLQVNTEPSGVINIWLQWRDPKVAYDVVDKAIGNFLQDRKQSETQAIADSIAILDQSVQALEAQVNRTIAELPKRAEPRRRARREVAAVATPVVLPEVSGLPPEMTARLAKIKAALEARQQEFAKLEGLRKQELAQAQARLAAASTIYTDGHPTVAALRQGVAGLARESTEEQAGRRAVERLELDYDTLNAAVLVATQQSDESKRAAALTLIGPTTVGPSEPEPPAADYASLVSATAEANDPTSLRLKVELAQLASVRERANAARAEMASAQAGFKYQYSLIKPPLMPREPTSPNVTAIFMAGALASVLLTLLGAVGADLASGRIVEPWQIERLVGIPVAIRVSDL